MFINSNKKSNLYKFFTEADKEEKVKRTIIRPSKDVGTNYIDTGDDIEHEDSDNDSVEQDSEPTDYTTDERPNHDTNEQDNDLDDDYDQTEDGPTDYTDNNNDEDSDGDQDDATDYGEDESDNEESDENSEDISDDNTNNMNSDYIISEETKKFNLYREFISLYEKLTNYINKLEAIVEDSNIANSILSESISNIRNLRSLLSDYMKYKFNDNSYIESSLYIKETISAVYLIIELLKKNNINVSS